uniref:Aquaporin1 n=1 Tax=Hemiscolopendra marginata TaxID=943146 RepID=A0A646QFQ9_9MYRI
MGYDAFGLSEITSRRSRLWRQLAAEFMGTLFIVLLGCGSTVSGWQDGDVATVFRIAFAFGFAVAAVVEAFGHVSGGHVNPAVTVAMLFVRRIQLIPGLLYIVFQLLGATTGAALLQVLTPAHLNSSLGLNTINQHLNSGQGLGVEFMITLLLILVVFSVTDEHRGEIKGAASVIIGITVTVGHLFSIRYTGCGMNPARVFGPAAVTGSWDNHWAYWIGECGGAIFAALLYIVIFCADDSGIYNRVFRTLCSSSSVDNLDQKESIPVSTVSVERIPERITQ